MRKSVKNRIVSVLPLLYFSLPPFITCLLYFLKNGATYWYDVRYQMMQAAGQVPFDTQTPAIHTLIIKFFAFGGDILRGPENLVVFQNIAFSGVIGLAFYGLYRQSRNKLLFILPAFYIFSERYIAYVDNPFKDGVYSLILLALVVYTYFYFEKKHFSLIAAVLLGFVCAFRLNAIIVFAGMFIAVAVYIYIRAQGFRGFTLTKASAGSP